MWNPGPPAPAHPPVLLQSWNVLHEPPPCCARPGPGDRGLAQPLPSPRLGLPGKPSSGVQSSVSEVSGLGQVQVQLGSRTLLWLQGGTRAGCESQPLGRPLSWVLAAQLTCSRSCRVPLPRPGPLPWGPERSLDLPWPQLPLLTPRFQHPAGDGWGFQSWLPGTSQAHSERSVCSPVCSGGRGLNLECLTVRGKDALVCPCPGSPFPSP